MNRHILNEIPPLSEKDCFHVIERHKTEFTFPLHQHSEFELNFIENGKGLRRIVGDSVEYIENYDLTLISGFNLEHVWEQGNCNFSPIREITVQFSADLFNNNLLDKNIFSSLSRMFKLAEMGISFPLKTIMKIYTQLDKIASEQQGFSQFIKLLNILHELSESEDIRTLASSSFAPSIKSNESRRVRIIKDYIIERYQDEISLQTISELVGMTPVSVSRFFKNRTGKTILGYIIDIRLGHASRILVDSTRAISEICFECGFNNISNFNRIFKKNKSITPKVFRSHYRKNKYVI